MESLESSAKYKNIQIYLSIKIDWNLNDDVYILWLEKINFVIWKTF